MTSTGHVTRVIVKKKEEEFSVHVNRFQSLFRTKLTVQLWTPTYCTYSNSEVTIAVNPILTCNAVPVTCEHIDCYYCNTWLSLVCISK